MTNSIALLFQTSDGDVNVRTVLDNSGLRESRSSYKINVLKIEHVD